MAFDPAQLNAAVASLQEVPGSLSAVVVRHGAVVEENHWADSPHTLHNICSVTKSVMSTLLGTAIDGGYISSVDDPMVAYLPSELIPAEPGKHDITLHHLLTMTSGLSFSDDGDWFDWLASDNPALFVLQRPLVSTPGTVFKYSSADTHLLSIILTHAVGVSTRDFADAYLFAPLGISQQWWERDPQGYYYGGHGLWLRTEDMAKLGVLLLGSGTWQGEQIVPVSWLATATRVHVEGGWHSGPLLDIDYGYLWWLDHSLGSEAVLAWGFGGQFVFCVAELGLVVAVNAEWEIYQAQAIAQENQLLDVIVSQLLAAVHPLPLPRRPSRRIQAFGQSERSGGEVSPDSIAVGQEVPWCKLVRTHVDSGSLRPRHPIIVDANRARLPLVDTS
jgi:CubicO group peptidase (beta-lactamase class C family)